MSTLKHAKHNKALKGQTHVNYSLKWNAQTSGTVSTKMADLNHLHAWRLVVTKSESSMQIACQCCMKTTSSSGGSSSTDERSGSKQTGRVCRE